MESPLRLPWQQVNNVLLYHGKYLCNNQVACLAQFIDTCCYKEKSTPFYFWNSSISISFFFFFFFLEKIKFQCKTIDLTQKSTNQQGQKWQLFFHFRFSLYFLCCNNQKVYLLRIQAHTFSLLQQQRKYNYNKPEMKK
jgi:hypothetical protein